jgi:hypothetical protein
MVWFGLLTWNWFYAHPPHSFPDEHFPVKVEEIAL